MMKTTVLFQSYPSYSNNAKILYEYMAHNYKNKMNLCWVIDNEEDYNCFKDKIPCVLYGSAEFKKVFSQATILFTTHGQLASEKLPKQIYVNLWHGIGMKKLGYMLDERKRAGQDNDYYNMMRLKVDYVICPAEFWRPIFSSIFKLSYNRVLPIGYPKFDMIINADKGADLEKILDIKLSKYDKKILYVPTFRKGAGRVDSKVNLNNVFNFPSYDENMVIKFLKKKNYLLCVKRHPSESYIFNSVDTGNIKEISNDALKEYNISSDEILNNFDLIITDYSSMGIEFQVLNRPAIFITVDSDEYDKNRGVVFDLDFWTGDNRVNNLDELLDKLDNFENINCDLSFRKLIFGNLCNSNCKNICEYFFNKDGMLKKTIIPNDDVILDKAKKLDGVLYEKSELEKQLNMIYSSKGWNYLEKLRKIKTKLFWKKQIK